MMGRLFPWFRERSLREQRLLLVMGALLAVTFLWLAVYRPIQNGLSAARERHQLAVIRLGDVRTQASALRLLGRTRVATVSGPLPALVTQAAGEAGFANAMVAAQGDRRVTVSIPSARPAPALAWFAALEQRGIIVERFSARANADPTLAIDATLARAN